jgi:hypothetical protein
MTPTLLAAWTINTTSYHTDFEEKIEMQAIRTDLKHPLSGGIQLMRTL